MNKLAMGTLMATVLLGCKRNLNESETLIVGGAAVTQNQSPFARHTVSLNDMNGKSYCSGSVYSQRHIITAAHCIWAKDDAGGLHIAFGPSTKGLKAGEAQTRAIAKITVHQDNGFGDLPMVPAGYPLDDLAMLELAEPLPPEMVPVLVVGANEPLTVGTSVAAVGYGRPASTSTQTGDLNFVEVPLRDNSDSRYRIAKVLFLGKSGKGKCNGDSGGPTFLVPVNTQLPLKQIGVASIVSGECELGMSIDTDLRFYREWLECTSGLSVEGRQPLSQEQLAGCKKLRTPTVCETMKFRRPASVAPNLDHFPLLQHRTSNRFAENGAVRDSPKVRIDHQMGGWARYTILEGSLNGKSGYTQLEFLEPIPNQACVPFQEENSIFALQDTVLKALPIDSNLLTSSELCRIKKDAMLDILVRRPWPSLPPENSPNFVVLKQAPEGCPNMTGGYIFSDHWQQGVGIP